MGLDPAWEEELVRKGLIPQKDRVDLTLKIMDELAVQTPSAVEALPGEGKAKKMRKRARGEYEFQKAVIDYAHLFRWKVAHFRTVKVQAADGSTRYQTPVDGDGEGFPDTIFVRRPKIIVAELKFGSNKTTKAQDSWLFEFAGCSIPVFVWHPSDWPEIEEALR